MSPVQHPDSHFFLGARWLSAEPAAVFDALLVRPSRSTLEAALAALMLVFRLFANIFTLFVFEPTRRPLPPLHLN